MNIDCNTNCTPLPECGENTIHNIFFDGRFYYLNQMCKQKVVKTDSHFCEISCFDTCRKYTNVCYDWNSECFYASSECCNNCLFKLNCEMREIGYISFSNCPENLREITGLSYNCCSDMLVVSYDNTVLLVNKDTGCSETAFNSRSGGITGIFSLCPGYFIIMSKNNAQRLLTVNAQGKILAEQHIDSNQLLINIFYNPCDCHEQFLDLFILKRGCDPHLCHYPIDSEQIGYKYSPCNSGICCHCPPKPPKPCPPKPCDCCEIIQSIALEEAALAHILNAEGEKLQKIIAISNHVDEILCVNEKVNETIINVTHLEHVLYAKLSAVLKCCECPKPPPCER